MNLKKIAAKIENFVGLLDYRYKVKSFFKIVN